VLLLGVATVLVLVIVPAMGLLYYLDLRGTLAYEGLGDRRAGCTCAPARGRRSGSSPWSNRRLDLVQVLAPVVSAHRVERTRFI
jgi:hypothetical protein